MKPLSRPIAAATRMATGIPQLPRAIVSPTQNQAASTPVKVATEAMLRSISAQSSTKVTPVAATAIGAIWVTTFCRFWAVRKTSVARLKKMNMLIRVTNGARSRALRLAQCSATCLPVRSSDVHRRAASPLPVASPEPSPVPYA